jgi:hypothetical protein
MGTDQRSFLPGLDHRQNRPSEEHKLRQIAFLRMHRALPDAIIWAGQVAKGAHRDRTVEDRVRLRGVQGGVLEGKDLDRWVPFYANDAEWTEYRHLSPPRAPNRMIGKQQIVEFLARVCRTVFGITADRVAFSVDCVFPDGKRIFEHVIAHIEDGKIARQVDVEAWDY